jgi:hypothetical protein
MLPEDSVKLRAPFDSDRVGKLPRIWCSACSRLSREHKACPDHRRIKCKECDSRITDAHLHIDYVGHADVTARLLNVDPGWFWEPMAFGPDGLPAVDKIGGLWIKLTVCGVTRPGYGSADGKTGGDAIKEAIGDALRNAAMRFGVALDLWSKTKVVIDAPGNAKIRKGTSQTGEPDPEAASIRRTIAAVGAQRGYTIDELAAEFAQWNHGAPGDIGTATPAVLAGFLAAVKALAVKDGAP